MFVGGLNDVGLQVANFLVSRGAKRLALVSADGGVRSGFQSLFARRWREKGVQVVTVEYDPARPEDAARLLDQADRLGSVAGVFQLEAAAQSPAADSFRSAYDRTAAFTVHLDAATRTRCRQLEHFVVWSSVASGRGVAGQSDLGYAQAALVRMSEARQAAGYPSVSVRPRAIAHVE